MCRERTVRKAAPRRSPPVLPSGAGPYTRGHSLENSLLFKSQTLLKNEAKRDTWARSPLPSWPAVKWMGVLLRRRTGRVTRLKCTECSRRWSDQPRKKEEDGQSPPEVGLLGAFLKRVHVGTVWTSIMGDASWSAFSMSRKFLALTHTNFSRVAQGSSLCSCLTKQSLLFPCLTSSAHSTRTPNTISLLFSSHGDDHCHDPQRDALFGQLAEAHLSTASLLVRTAGGEAGER